MPFCGEMGLEGGSGSDFARSVLYVGTFGPVIGLDMSPVRWAVCIPKVATFAAALHWYLTTSVLLRRLRGYSYAVKDRLTY
jgi:hypothetical protein